MVHMCIFANTINKKNCVQIRQQIAVWWLVNVWKLGSRIAKILNFEVTWFFHLMIQL